MSEPIRVLVAAADPLVRAGLAALLDGQDTCRVVARVSPGEWSASPDAFDMDACVLDLGWSEADLDPVVEALLDSEVLPLVVLTDLESELRLDAPAGRGWLGRDAGGAEIAAALAAAVLGFVVVDPTLVTHRTLPHSGAEDLPEKLTDREREVLSLMAEGISNREIAMRLGITENTVKYHVNGVLRKLEAQSRTEAAVRAARLGLVRL